MCVLCKSIVRSEAVWKVHLNAKQHKENIELAKKLKEQATAPKRPASSDDNSTIPQKKVRGILKNSSNTDKVPDDFFDAPKKLTFSIETKSDISNTKIENFNSKNSKQETDIKESPTAEVLPEGFFDDPKLDAKARNLEYKDPVEEEWERFQKEIKEVDHKSAEIIAEDQEEATTERQIDEIEEQMRNLSRVLDLEKKKEDVKIAAPEEPETEEASDVEEDENFDEYLDWRAKKSFK